MNTNSIGKKGEKKACTYLKRHGYKIIACNFSCRFGEIDVIAQNKEYICFVEVKTRNRKTIALPREFVNNKKQERLIKTAQMFLAKYNTEKQPRFDVIEISETGLFGKKTVHIENAFDV